MSAAGIRDQHITLSASNPEEDGAGGSGILAQFLEHCALGGPFVIDSQDKLSLTAVEDVKSCPYAVCPRLL